MCLVLAVSSTPVSALLRQAACEAYTDFVDEILGMTTTSTSLVIKELRSQLNKPNECGGCGVASRPKGEALLACGKCKNRKYCSTSCQKKHWKIHKKVCESAKVSL